MKVSILTPSGVVEESLSCSSVLLPTSQGEVNVLPSHVQYLTQLGTGLVEVTADGGHKKRYTVTHGTCKVVKDEVVILSITSESADTIDLERAERAKKIAQEKLAHWENLQADEVIKYQRKLERAENRLKLGYLR